MLKKRNRFWLVVAVAALVLIVAACGSDDDSAARTSDTPQAGDTAELPPAVDAPADTPVVEGACLPEEPECGDALVVDPEVGDLSGAPGQDADSEAAGAASSSAMPVDGELTVSEALASRTSEVIAVRGHLFDDSRGFLLCERLTSLGERYGCDGERIAVTGLDPSQVPDIVFFEGTTYTEEEITVLGELNDGTLAIDQLVAG